jgi:eukaryotic-like serine/threonine-protein kinase
LDAGKTAGSSAALHNPYKPDDVLVDRYRIIKVAQLGGVSALYQAFDLSSPEPHRLVAIKEEILQPDEFMDADTLRQDFLRNAAIFSSFDHPGIPHIFEGFALDSQTYLVTEFVEGKDLEDTLSEMPDRVDIRKIYTWGIEIADILSYLHTQQPEPVIYRDLKPANVMLLPSSKLKLIDFGIAGVFSEKRVYSPLGTDGYAAPEQYNGQVTPSVDIYALGATMHHLLTRDDPRLRSPFSFDKRPIRKLNPKVPEPLEAIVMRALAFEMWNRYHSIGEMLGALRAIDDQIPAQ